MDDRQGEYKFSEIEAKWQGYWEDNKTFAAGEDKDKPKYYVLDMFPYPSGQGLHVGHPEGYTASDIVSRYKRMKGFNVLHPIGWDAFGLPAEQYAVQTGTHPADTTQKNIANMRRQIKSLGFSYDWDRQVDTTDPNYYKWTQWIFLKFYNSFFETDQQKARPIELLEDALAEEPKRKNEWENSKFLVSYHNKSRNWGNQGSLIAELYDSSAPENHNEDNSVLRETLVRKIVDSERLAYESFAPVNWCPELGTVLANEEVIGGVSERGGHPVVRKPMRQWMLRITKYCERLLDGLADVDWSPSIKKLQHDWIGKSIGAEVDFKVDGHNVKSIRVFTTRPDTLFGATYMVLAPEHEHVDMITTNEYVEAVADYKFKALNKSDLDRTDLAKDKSGQFTGAYAINPVNGKKIPIWISDYVLISYGTGAIMAVPAHDERDYEFATKFKLPIIPVVEPDRKTALSLDITTNYNYDGPIEEKVTQEEWDAIADSIIDKVRNGGSPFTKPVSNRLELEVENCVANDSLAVQEVRDRIRDYVIVSGCTAGDGWAINSGEFTGLPTAEFKEKIAAWLEKKGLGKAAINFKLRDWLFSRQRYWGEPFPIIHAEDGRRIALDESELPLELPKVENYKPTGTGEPPLSNATDWVRLNGRKDKDGNTYVYDAKKDATFVIPPGMSLTAADVANNPNAPLPHEASGISIFKGRRETNTMPQWAGSCWYYLRYTDPNNNNAPFDLEKENYWLPVDLYIGGAEHAVLHLLYSRFWHKLLYDLGYVKSIEPFKKLINQGMILGADGQKMSKSRGNVVNPDDVIDGYGADSMRLYEMFMGPLEASKPWNMHGVEGVYRFLSKVWRTIIDEETGAVHSAVQDAEADAETAKLLNQTIKKVGDDIENFAFNTAISQMMIFINHMSKLTVRPKSALEKFVLVLSPLAPHVGEELWQLLGHEGTLAYVDWPEYDSELIKEKEIELAVQVLGKIKDRIVVSADASEDAIKEKALASEKVQAAIAGKTVRKVIVIKSRLVNIVAS